jgi:hypothetical protein
MEEAIEVAHEQTPRFVWTATESQEHGTLKKQSNSAFQREKKNKMMRRRSTERERERENHSQTNTHARAHTPQ